MGAVLHAEGSASRLRRRGVPTASATRARSPPAISPSVSARRARGGIGTTPRWRSSTSSGAARVTVTRRATTSPAIYDLTERVIPAEVLARPALPEHDARKQLLELAARHHGDRHAQRSHRLPPPGPPGVQAAASPSWSRRAAAPRGPRRGLEAAGVPPSRDARIPRRDQRLHGAQPVRPGRVEPRARRAPVRLPLPHRDLHPAAEAHLRLLRAADPAGETASSAGST